MRTPARDSFRWIAVAVFCSAVPLSGCYGTAGYVETDDGVYDVDGPDVDPSAAFVATTQPYYYDGRPTYWYGNRWRYRQGDAWAHYRAEPAALHTARMRGDGGGFRGVEPAGGFRGASAAGGFRGGAARGARWR